MTLADGFFLLVEGKGTVQLSLPLILSSILSIPHSPFNLMSFSKLAKNLNACVSFFPDSNLIQDLTTWKTIGVGHGFDGL